MERAAYREMAELDQRHWWYRARRAILADLIRREVAPPVDARILEIGCGTGHNLEMLGRFGQLEAIELDDESRAIAEKRLGRGIMSARLPELAGIPDRHYDMIAALDVIEHIDDDVGAIAAIATRLKPGGKFIMTVPAHPWMWSAHDTVNHHKRRYSKRGLRQLIEGSPLRLQKIGYFNSLLFPLVAAARVAGKMIGRDSADDKLPSAPVNAVLNRIFGLEAGIIGRLPMPFGVSLVAVVRRPV